MEQETRTLRTGSIFNWEDIQAGKDVPTFRGTASGLQLSKLQPPGQDIPIDDLIDLGLDPERHQDNMDQSKESKALIEDLDLVNVAHEIGTMSVQSSIHFTLSRLADPFVELVYISQLHDAVEELIETPSLDEKIEIALLKMQRTWSEIGRKYQAGLISARDVEIQKIEEFPTLGRVLDTADSKVLRDIGDLLQSHKMEEAPVGTFYKILRSPSIKARVDVAGYELFPHDEATRVNHKNSLQFTDEKRILEMCITMSVQKARANQLLYAGMNLTTYIAALADWAQARELVRPMFNKENCVEIIDGYHPLLVSSLRKGGSAPVVKHTTRINSETKVLAITGPNMAGKTTYVKELMLISLLGQAGSYVPARSANNPVYSRFLTHFGGDDNLLENISLFQAEIEQLSRDLGKLEEGALLGCDELFRGTESGKNGGSLLHKAVVESLVYDYPGRTMLSSHYHEALQEQAKLPHMKFVRVNTTEEGAPLYTVSEGIDAGGYAVKAAIRAGLPQRVAERLSGNGRLH